MNLLHIWHSRSSLPSNPTSLFLTHNFCSSFFECLTSKILWKFILQFMNVLLHGDGLCRWAAWSVAGWRVGSWPTSSGQLPQDTPFPLAAFQQKVNVRGLQTSSSSVLSQDNTEKHLRFRVKTFTDNMSPISSSLSLIQHHQLHICCSWRLSQTAATSVWLREWFQGISARSGP